MNSLKRNWTFLAIGSVSLVLGAIAVLTALRLQQLSPVAPTAPQPQRAIEGSPVPACQLTFVLTLASPQPSPSASASPGSSPLASASPGSSPQPSPSASASPQPSPSNIGGPQLGLDVEKFVDHTTANRGDMLTYTVRLRNSGQAPIYDTYFDENLSDYTDYQAPSMACTFTDVSTGQTTNTGFEIDNLSDGFDTTPDSESASFDVFRVAGDLTEANNTWDLDLNDYITCTYRVTVNNNVSGGTSIRNVVTGHADSQNGDQTGETELTDTDDTTVTVSTIAASPSPVPYCNTTCSASSQCPSNLVCYVASGQTTGNCRAPNCTGETDCICAGVSASPSPTPSVTPQVPKAGTSWPTLFLIIGGIVLLGIGLAF